MEVQTMKTDIFITFFLETKSDNAAIKTVDRVVTLLEGLIKKNSKSNCELLEYEIQVDKKSPL